MAPPPLDPSLDGLDVLLGVWEGAGQGEYPTIEDFGYHERVELGHVGKPFLVYGQRTRHADDGRPLHAETGYLRRPAPDRVELVLAHPTGVTEVAEGTLSVRDGGLSLRLASTAIGLTGSAKEVAALERDIDVDGDVLRYDLRMAAVGVGLTHHLTAELQRVG